MLYLLYIISLVLSLISMLALAWQYSWSHIFHLLQRWCTVQHKAFKGDERQHTDWFDPCYARNTPMVIKGVNSTPLPPCTSLCAKISGLGHTQTKLEPCTSGYALSIVKYRALNLVLMHKLRKSFKVTKT